MDLSSDIVRECKRYGFVAFWFNFHCYQPIKYWSWYQFWGFSPDAPKVESAALSPNQPRNAEGHLSKGRGGRIWWQGANASRNQTTGFANPDWKPTSFLVRNFVVYLMVVQLWIHTNHAVGTSCVRSLVSRLWKGRSIKHYEESYLPAHPCIPHCSLSWTCNRINYMLRTTSLWCIAAETSVLKILQNVPSLLLIKYILIVCLLNLTDT